MKERFIGEFEKFIRGRDFETFNAKVAWEYQDYLNDYKRNGINLRYTSTLSILLWKSFVKNYPDKDIGSYVIIHLGESRTLVIVVTDHIFQFSRKIALGAQDFYKAIVKQVETNESGQTIDITLAKDILKRYGYPQNQQLLVLQSGYQQYR